MTQKTLTEKIAAIDEVIDGETDENLITAAETMKAALENCDSNMSLRRRLKAGIGDLVLLGDVWIALDELEDLRREKKENKKIMTTDFEEIKKSLEKNMPFAPHCPQLHPYYVDPYNPRYTSPYEMPLYTITCNT